MPSYDAGLVCNYYHEADLKGLTNAITIASCGVSTLSLLGRCYFRQWNAGFPSNLSTQLTLVAALLSLTILVSTILDYEQMSDRNPPFTGVCLAQGIFFQFFAITIVIYWQFIGFVTWLVIVRRKTLRAIARYDYVFHLACWPVATFFTLGPMAFKGRNVYGPASGIAVCYLEV